MKLSPSKPNKTTGLEGEWAVYYLLKSCYGLNVVKQPHLWAFDLWVNEKLNIEVKTAKPRIPAKTNLPGWNFNIHRHGKLPELQPDFYLFRLEDIPFTKKAIHLLLKAPITVMTITITIRSLLNQNWHKEREEFLQLVGRSTHQLG